MAYLQGVSTDSKSAREKLLIHLFTYYRHYYIDRNDIDKIITEADILADHTAYRRNIFEQIAQTIDGYHPFVPLKEKFIVEHPGIQTPGGIKDQLDYIYGALERRRTSRSG